MSSDPKKTQSTNAEQFEREASREQSGVLAELWDFLKNNKKWWLIPIVLVLLIVGVLVVLGGTAAAPFIYTLF